MDRRTDTGATPKPPRSAETDELPEQVRRVRSLRNDVGLPTSLVCPRTLAAVRVILEAMTRDAACARTR